MSSDRNYLHEKIADVRLYETVTLIIAVIGLIAIVSGFLLIAFNLPLPVRGEIPTISKIGGIATIIGMILFVEGSLFAARFSEQKSEYMKKMEEMT